ncbi:MAG: alpha/beta hydrolase [Octadecabacter sp.]|nr:alpha/beta hydrolase [Octadecabacter sp.]
MDWDDAFDNSGYVDDSEAIRAVWAARAERARANLAAETGVYYGPDPRQALDLFLPEGTPKGLVVFIHGGYWHLMDRSYFSHMALGPLAHGWAVAVVEYPVAPHARIADITSSVAEAVKTAAGRIAGPIHIIGHSAGGHLAARMACADSPLGPLVARLAGVVAVSGVFDLLPLLATKMNGTLGLDAAEARAESPARLLPDPSVPVTFYVGADERPEFLRQNRLCAERWARAGGAVSTVYEPERHHFDVVDSLEDPDGALTHALFA